jgi:hypothetical protein
MLRIGCSLPFGLDAGKITKAARGVKGKKTVPYLATGDQSAAEPCAVNVYAEAQTSWGGFGRKQTTIPNHG